MGGNIFKNTRRLDKAEFEPYQEEVVSILKNQYENVQPTLYYRNKESFGDLDIIIQKPMFEKIVFELPWRVFGAKQFSYNGDIASFCYQDFQVDCIFVDPEHFQTAVFYFSYNDLNNLVGRIAHKFGLKFGWDGLKYLIRSESGHHAKEIQLSYRPRDIYEFLNLDYDRYKQGFDDLEDIFKFVSSSKFFNSDSYEYENLNHENRARNKKRKTYQAFIEWLSLNKQNLPNYQFSKNKSDYLIRIHNHFIHSDLLGQLKNHAKYVALMDENRSKFNGDLVREWSGLEGKELGSAISEFKLYSIGAQNASDFNKYLSVRSSGLIQFNFGYWFIYERNKDVDRNLFSHLPLYKFVFGDQ